jgi:hypothetical protein
MKGATCVQSSLAPPILAFMGLQLPAAASQTNARRVVRIETSVCRP